MTHRNLVKLFSGALLAFVVYGCGDNVPTVGPSAGLLEVDPLYAGVDQATTKTLSATLNGDPAAVTWESSNEAVATVSADGVVTGIAPGTAAVTAKLVSDPTKERSSSITVIEVPTLVAGTPHEWTDVASGSLARDDGLVYKFIVPQGATSLTVDFTGGTGDGDIYVQGGAVPDVSGDENPGCHSFNAGNDEECVVANPQPGIWYVFIAVWDPYADATLTATIK